MPGTFGLAFPQEARKSTMTLYTAFLLSLSLKLLGIGCFNSPLRPQPVPRLRFWALERGRKYPLSLSFPRQLNLFRTLDCWDDEYQLCLAL